MKKNTLKENLFKTLPVILISTLLVFIIIYAWTEPHQPPPQGNVPPPLNVSIQTQEKEGSLVLGTNPNITTGLIVQHGNVGIGTKTPNYKLDVQGSLNVSEKLCIRGDCRESWPDTPLSNLNHYTAGHLWPLPYPPDPDFPKGGDDYYKRDGVYPYPYLVPREIISKVGVDPKNPYATNWFLLGYSYKQPWEPLRKAVFIEEGDNSYAMHVYTNLDGRFKNPDDKIHSCCYFDPGQVCTYYDKDTCDKWRSEGKKVTYYIADSTSNLKGRLLLEIRLVAGNEYCKNKDYFPHMLIGSWGDTRVTNFRITPYQLPNVPEDDNCKGQNVHSKIQGRFIIYEEPPGFPRDPIINFADTKNDIIYMIKSLGHAYLTWIK